jgi:hypothetical protein
VDLSQVHNPYDFANPVSDTESFVGRRDELDEIQYYLEHARTAPRPINIALLGPRAAGKTSLLNVTEILARQRSFCTVRIDLDEGDAVHQLPFFFKLFDNVLASACHSGAYGGRFAKTYDTYLDIVSSFHIPEDKAFCPFVFPLQYARAMAANNLNIHVSDQNLKTDLVAISAELRRPLLLLFDEGNVLARSRVHLEKLRNTFMNLPGYMLVITGTPDLFPVMDEVFSPIVRQFKKISIDAFRRFSDTQDCIRRPLERLGMGRDEIFAFFGDRDAHEIHELSGGRPHEIQLICHILFRRVQTNRAARMKLDLSALDELRRELETSSNIATRPVISKVRVLTHEQLEALALLTAARAPFDHIWTSEYIVNGTELFSEDDLRRHLDYFTQVELVKQDETGLTFAGDDFDKIYCRYLAKEKDVAVSFSAFPIDLFWHTHVVARLTRIDGVEVMMSLWFNETETDFASLAGTLGDQEATEDIFVTQPNPARELYNLMLLYRDFSSVPILRLRLSLPWLKAASVLYGDDPQATAPLHTATEEASAMAARARERSTELLCDRLELPVAPLEVLARKVEQSANQRVRAWISDEHIGHMIDCYLERRDGAAALLHAELVLRYGGDLSWDKCNNVGYVLLANGQIDRAKALLNRAKASATSEIKSALPRYNLAICEIHQLNTLEAKTIVEGVLDTLTHTSKEDRQHACLFVARVSAGALLCEEEQGSPDIVECATKTLQALNAYHREQISSPHPGYDGRSDQ